MQATRAVLFDFGGTLCTYEGVQARFEENAARLEATVPGVTLEEALGALRQGMAEAMRAAEQQAFYLQRTVMQDGVRRAGRSLQHDLPDQEVDLFVDNLNAALAAVVPRPGMRATLEALRDRGLHLGGVSNADHDQFEHAVTALGVQDLFHDLLCSEEARSCKPDARIFEMALGRAGCTAAEAVFVGDTPAHDIAGASAVGMRTVLIEEPTDVPFDRGVPDADQVIIRELSEVLQHV